MIAASENLEIRPEGFKYLAHQGRGYMENCGIERERERELDPEHERRRSVRFK